MRSSRNTNAKSELLQSLQERFSQASNQQQERVSEVRIENCIGFSKVPLGIAGPLRVGYLSVHGRHLRTARHTLSNGMSRDPVFVFANPGHAAAFAKTLPTMQSSFARWAEETSKHVKLQLFKPTLIGSRVHIFCSYDCGSAAGQNMVTKATQYACDMLRKLFADEYQVRDFFIEGQLASDEKPSWGNVMNARGVEVFAWGKITPAACQYVLGCTTERLYRAQQTLKEGGIRNGQFGSNINTSNVIAAIFISTGQDPASTAEGSWSHLTSELDSET
ncbi:hypothetical protein CDV36_016499, partial [Fusarium kuroshium]